MNAQHFIRFLVFLQFVAITHQIFHSALKKLKQKSKDAYRKNFGKDKTWHFLGFDLTEYPGTNEKFRQINKDKWNDYYKCLESQNANLGVVPEAVQVFESTSIRLECKMCLSPQEIKRSDFIHWYFATPQETKFFKLVEYTENTLLSPTDKSLHMYNLRREQTGQYICRIGKTGAPPYFLTVVDSKDDDLLEVHSPEAAEGPYPQQPQRIKGYDLIVDTKWTPWTSCSKCDQIGRRHKLGYCFVKYEENAGDKTNATKDEETESISIPQKDYDLLGIFKSGMPCSSYILPSSIKRLEHIKHRKNEIMTGYCRVACPENKIFEVRDKNGNVIERANNSAGIYSVLQGVPSAQPSVERLLLYADKGKEVVLSCPGNLNSDVPVQWQIGAKKLVPELLAVETNGRIYISITDKVHIKDARISDTNIYSCWQHQDLAGTVRLIVEKNFSLDFNHHVMLLGAVAIFSVFLYVFARAFFRRKSARAAA